MESSVNIKDPFVFYPKKVAIVSKYIGTTLVEVLATQPLGKTQV